MNTQSYVRKYNLSKDTNFNHSDFIADFAIDFISMIEYHGSSININNWDNVITQINKKWEAINNKTIGNLPDKLWNYFWATIVVPLKEQTFPEMKNEEQKIRFMHTSDLSDFVKSKGEFYGIKLAGISYGNYLTKIKFELIQKIEDTKDYFFLFASKEFNKRFNKQENDFEKQRDKEWQEWQTEYEKQRKLRDEWFNNIFFNLGLKSSTKPDKIYYTSLLLSEDASLEDVITSYRKLSIIHHPDKKGGSHDKFIEITEAKNKLTLYLKK